MPRYEFTDQRHTTLHSIIILLRAVLSVGCIMLGSWLASSYAIQLSFAQESPSENSNLETKNTPQPLVTTKQSTAQIIIRTTEVFAILRAVKKTSLMAQTNGRIDEILASSGSPLKQGDVILKLNPENRLALVDEAKALVKQRTIEYKAGKLLNQKGHRSDSELARNYTDLENAKAALQTYELDYQYTFVKAPYDGTIDRLQVDPGDTLKARETIIATFVDDHHMLAQTYVPETIISNVTLNSQVHAMIGKTASLVGTVHFISHIANPQTRSYLVEILLDNSDGQLKDGMTVELTLPLETVEAHTIAPSTLALDENGNIGVKVVDDEHMVSFYPVTIIKSDTNTLWVTGLPKNISVITLGQAYVNAGSYVRIAKEP